MQIIKQRQHKRNEIFCLVFEWNDHPGAGFSFPCDKQGYVEVEGLNPAAAENLAKCLNGDYAVTTEGVRDWSNDYTEPAVGKCSSCGREVELYDLLTNECPCGALYNGFGQGLAPQSQWEETWGED